MKKILNKIRRWLIKKLGGYAEPYITMTRTEVPINKFHCSQAIDKKIDDENPDYIKERLFHLAAIEILPRVATIRKSDDRFSNPDTVVYTLSFYAAKDNGDYYYERR